ncbi:50S ribosomal protein L3 [Syntrophobacter fumaroxidans]|uniref:Large ribosomal subunit protein uL3 n=1 Tax=Syntrophobacter fumaroxidans (strain DSM 10017 / MPOB) TaxID=335543 RepID=RL3_SYNFM|nr:50S ribosomal protein L3 [Syntrophobacter fumaroxidans]A0LIJ0.1 RecName: Full=Large ribosomal subunit protein uL3; AltName: Full=50S ribosomal protein L3 [Syntrophobacter fumaroxidans MPOB]ABK17242.1 LSU ribosomal protein L3P [Syntrophobacter fumaroxidans MPOB]HOI93606.1 50S ribosomal protein L3 [Syntrophobacter fumaroxidans]
MIKAIVGRKLQMSQIFAEDGTAVPITLIQAGPCTVTQVKTPERDGYSALQIGFGSRKPKNVNKPMKGHLDKVGKGYFEVLREIRMENASDHEVGEDLAADVFEIGERIDVIGTTKGKGYAGTIKRWGFQRGPSGHGSKNIREPGSTGNATFPGRVIKGKKMPGQKGNKRTTVMNLRIIDVRPEENLLIVKGAVPGSQNGIVLIRKTNRAK